MKAIILITLLVFSVRIYAEDLLFSHNSMPIVVHSSGQVVSVERDGAYLKFNLSSNKYTVSAMILNLGEYERVPTIAQVNELLYRSNKNRYPDLQIFDKADNNVRFRNKNLVASLYLTKYKGNALQLCDYNYVYKIKNLAYLNLTVTTKLEICEYESEELSQFINQLFQSIEIKDI